MGVNGKRPRLAPGPPHIHKLLSLTNGYDFRALSRIPQLARKPIPKPYPLARKRKNPAVGTAGFFMCQSACKPGSVRPAGFPTDAAAIHLGRRLRAASCNPPGRRLRKKSAALARRVPSLFGLAPGGVYLAVPVTRPAVGSYPTLSPLPRHLLASCDANRRRGGFLSVALSLGSPPPDVIRHRLSVEPGLSSLAAFRHMAKRGCPAGWQAAL